MNAPRFSDRARRFPIIQVQGSACLGRCADALRGNRSATKSRFPRRLRAFEDVRVQALGAQPGVERLDVRVVRPHPGSAEVESHILATDPPSQRARSGLRPPMAEACASCITADFRGDLDSRLSTSITSCAENDPRAPVASASRLYWLSTVSTRSLRSSCADRA